MRITTKTILLASAVVLLVVATGVGAYYFLYGQSDSTDTSGKQAKDTSPVNYEAPREEQVDGGTQIKKDKYASDDSTGSQSAAVSLRFSQSEQVGNSVRIRTIINTLTSNGTCKLTVTDASGSQVYSTSAGVQAASSYSTCKGFDVPTSELEAGVLVFAVVFTSDTSTASAKVSLEVTK